MSIAPIPLKTQIVDKMGAITEFFRLRWEELRTQISAVSCKAIVTLTGQHATIATSLLLTTTIGGLYRVTFAARRTTPDGVASTLTFVWRWVDGGTPFSKTATVNNTDTTGDLYSVSQAFPADVNTAITFDVTYTSNTPGAMVFKISVAAELLVQG